MRTRCVLAVVILLRAGVATAGAVSPALASAPAASAPRWAGLTEWSFQHVAREQGLPNANAVALAQDAEGFLWVGTPGGVARWDGHRFRSYRAEPGQAGALPDSLIQAVSADRQGRIWVGTNSGGVLRYERASDRFTPFGTAQGLSHASVRVLAADGDGGMWVGTESGLDHISAQGQVRTVQRGSVSALMRDAAGRLWVGQRDQLLRSDEAGANFQSVLLPPQGGQGVPQAMALRADSAGRVWIGTRRHGLFVLESGAAAARPVPVAGLADRYVSDLLEPRPGELWIGTLTDGLFALEVDSGRVRHVRHRPELPSTLGDNGVRAMLMDRAGIAWIGTNQGLSRIEPQQRAVTTLFGARALGGDAEKEALTSPDVSWVLAQPSGRVWLATQAGGIDIIDPAAGRRVAALRPDPAHPETALPGDLVLALERAADGSVFVATRRGLYRAQADGSGVVRMHLPGRDPGAATWALRAEGDTLWVGGEADGLWRFDLRSGQAAAVAAMGGAPERSLSDRRIVVLERARPDEGGGPRGLWVGTRDGLNLLDPDTGLVRRPGPGVVPGFITHLYHDARQRLWVGRYGGGIDVLPAGAAALRSPPVKHLGSSEGLPDDNVNVMLEDRAGRLWASTDNGLAVVDPATMALRPLRRAEGVMFPTYWTGSGARTESGELLFGGAGGLTIVQPEALTAWSHQPRVLVSELRIGGRLLPPPPASGTAAAALQVPARANSLSVEFSSDDFSAPERNRHAYRLEGYDADWTETDVTHRRATYTNLPPGAYTLRLRVSNRDGVWGESPLALPLRVLPAWHQTWWFRGLLVLMAGVGVLGLLQWRTRLLQRRRLELEAKVHARTAELEAVSRALQEKTRVLEQLNLTDPLTGLRNRRFLDEHIDTVIAASLRRAKDVPALGGDTDNLFMLVDIDHFKDVNDHRGHAAGDAVLMQFAQRLRVVMRESDLLVRWGGEEFLVVARDTDRARAEELAERVRASVAEVPFVLSDGRVLSVTCSVGLAAMPFLPADAQRLGWQEVVQLADVALLAAKRAGRNAWVVLRAGAAAQAEGLLRRAQDGLPEALARGELVATSSRSLGGEAPAAPHRPPELV